jgi:hypothetical protein
VELRIAAEAGLERGGECGGAPPVAVEKLEALKPLLVAEPADRDARLRLEQPAQMGGA